MSGATRMHRARVCLDRTARALSAVARRRISGPTYDAIMRRVRARLDALEAESAKAWADTRAEAQRP